MAYCDRFEESRKLGKTLHRVILSAKFESLHLGSRQENKLQSSKSAATSVLFSLNAQRMLLEEERNLLWAWMLWSPYALGRRTDLRFGHGCSGHCVLLEHERNSALGMDARVTVGPGARNPTHARAKGRKKYREVEGTLHPVGFSTMGSNGLEAGTSRPTQEYVFRWGSLGHHSPKIMRMGAPHIKGKETFVLWEKGQSSTLNPELNPTL